MKFCSPSFDSAHANRLLYDGSWMHQLHLEAVIITIHLPNFFVLLLLVLSVWTDMSHII